MNAKTFTINISLHTQMRADFESINKAECKDKLKNGGFHGWHHMGWLPLPWVPRPHKAHTQDTPATHRMHMYHMCHPIVLRCSPNCQVIGPWPVWNHLWSRLTDSLVRPSPEAVCRHLKISRQRTFISQSEQSVRVAPRSRSCLKALLYLI